MCVCLVPPFSGVWGAHIGTCALMRQVAGWLVYVKVFFFFCLIPGTEADARNDASCNQTFEQVLRIHLTAECNAAGVGVCNQLLVK